MMQGRISARAHLQTFNLIINLNQIFVFTQKHLHYAISDM